MVAQILKQYKLPNGQINYPTVFSIPTNERLPALIDKDFINATALVVAALTLAFEKMNFKKRIDGVLINNIADDIIDTASVDNISLEDLMLFLQKMVRGEYGLVEEMSIARFNSLFDKYRDERHEAVIEIRENEHLQYKGLGPSERSNQEDALSEHFARMSDTISTLRQNMRELKQQSKG